jgi:hypothetical protein
MNSPFGHRPLGKTAKVVSRTNRSGPECHINGTTIGYCFKGSSSPPLLSTLRAASPGLACRPLQETELYFVDLILSMGVWQGVAIESLKFHPGPPCLTLLGPAGGPPLVARPQGRRSAAVAYPFEQSKSYAYVFIWFYPQTNRFRPTGPRAPVARKLPNA